MKLMNLGSLTKRYHMGLITGVALTPVVNNRRLRTIDSPPPHCG